MNRSVLTSKRSGGSVIMLIARFLMPTLFLVLASAGCGDSDETPTASERPNAKLVAAGGTATSPGYIIKASISESGDVARSESYMLKASVVHAVQQ